MKTIYLLIISILLICIRTTNAQTWQWTHPEKNSDPQNQQQAHDVEVDPSGNIYVLGDFLDSLFLNHNFIAKGGGSYLAKYDSTSKLLWYKLIQCTDTVLNAAIRATDLTVNSTGVYITGKYLPSSGYTYDCSTNIGAVISLNSYKIGSFSFSSPGYDVGYFLTKFNSNGNFVWNKIGTHPVTCKDGSYQELGAVYQLSKPVITSDKKNNIISSFMIGSADASISIGGDAIPLRQGQTALNPYYLVVAKYNSSGTLQWSSYAGGGFTFSYPSNYYGAVSECLSLVSDNNNNIFFVGQAGDSTFFGSHLFRASGAQFPTFISKISSAGVWQFVKELGSNTSNPGNSLIYPDLLCADGQNNIYALVNLVSTGGQIPTLILGDTIPDPASENAFAQYLVKIKNNGKLTWYKGFDGNSFSYANANSICYANNSLYITGDASAYAPAFGSLTVLRNPLSGGQEYFVAKANTDGDFEWVATAGSSGTSQLPYSNGMEGLAVRVFNDNIYTAGYYVGGITTLGNLNGSYVPPFNSYIQNIFVGKLKDQYIRVGAITPTSIIPGCTLTIPFTSTGLTFSTGNTFTAELSSANGDFASPIVIGSVASTGTGSITATIPATLSYSSGYRVRIRSSDTLKTELNYYAYADMPYVLSLTCPAPSIGFAATDITATSAKLNWTMVGCASGYKVQYRKKGTTTWTTVNITNNTPVSNVTGLVVNTIYQWRVATKCKNNGSNSFSDYSANKQFTTAASLAANDAIASSINSFGSLQIAVQPNPVITVAKLVINGNVENASITITNFIGKTVWKKDHIKNDHVNLPTEKLAAGVYVVKVVDGTKTSIIKLVKE